MNRVRRGASTASGASLVAVVVLLLVVAATWPAGQASAHAELVEITPADGQLVQEAPSEVVLRFSEPVSLTGGSAQVLNDDAVVVSAEADAVDATVVIPLPAGLGGGTYTATWEVISADSHRISGASVYHVGAPSAGGGAIVVPDGGDVGWGVRAGTSGSAALAYAAALLSVGGWWFTLLVADRSAPRQLDRHFAPPWRTVVVGSSVLGAVAVVAAVPWRLARIGGGLSALRDEDFVSESLRGPIGVSTAVTAIGLLVMAGLVAAARWPRRPVLGWSAAVVGGIALAGFGLEGHTRSQRPLAVMVGFDIVHLGAAATWLGGIAGLVTAFRSRVEPGRLGAMVARFSTAAVAAVVLVAAAGIGMSWIVLSSPGDLVSTGYGLALVTKVVLVAAVVVLGAYNRRRLVPAVSVGAAASKELRRRLGRVVRIEFVVLLAVIAVTSVLVARSPVSSTAAAPPAVTTPQDAVELPLSSGDGTASFVLAPGQAGSNEIRLVLLDPARQPLDPIETPIVELTGPTLDCGPVRPLVHPIGDGDYHVIADVAPAGSWELTIRVRISDFEVATASTVVQIGP